MMFYLHIGAELSGRGESNQFVDKWIHQIPLFTRLEWADRAGINKA